MISSGKRCCGCNETLAVIVVGKSTSCGNNLFPVTSIAKNAWHPASGFPSQEFHLKNSTVRQGSDLSFWIPRRQRRLRVSRSGCHPLCSHWRWPQPYLRGATLDIQFFLSNLYYTILVMCQEVRSLVDPVYANSLQWYPFLNKLQLPIVVFTGLSIILHESPL